jgi:hypothetical protein
VDRCKCFSSGTLSRLKAEYGGLIGAFHRAAPGNHRQIQIGLQATGQLLPTTPSTRMLQRLQETVQMSYPAATSIIPQAQTSAVSFSTSTVRLSSRDLVADNDNRTIITPFPLTQTDAACGSLWTPRKRDNPQKCPTMQGYRGQKNRRGLASLTQMFRNR